MDPYLFDFLALHVPDLNPGPYIPIYGCCNGSRIDLNVTLDEWESLSYGNKPPRLAVPYSPFCGWWHVNESFYKAEKKLVLWGFDFQPKGPWEWGLLRDIDLKSSTMGVPTWKKSHLLSLPKELRLEIWKWTLSDPSVPDLVANIGRDKKYARRDSATGAIIPRVKAWLEPGRNCSIGLSLLRTNRFIYEEALPSLYQSVRFAPADHQGIFPLFLDSLSPSARSLIRHVKLHVPRQIYDIDLFGAPADSLFHWAITCAQIAKLQSQLRDVEIEGLWFDSQPINERTKRAILYPLCKIKTKKVFGQNNDEGMESLLMSAKRDLARQADRRRAQAASRASTDDAHKEEREEVNAEKGKVDETLSQPSEQPRSQDSDVRRPYHSYPFTPDGTMRRSLSTVAGIDVFEQELEEDSNPGVEPSSTDDGTILADDWDLISYRSNASTPTDRPPSYMSRWSTDSWTDVASTISDLNDLDKDEVVSK